MNGCWIFAKAFSESAENHVILVFVFSFVDVVYDINFVYVEPSMQSWDLSDLVVVYDPFYALMDLVC